MFSFSVSHEANSYWCNIVFIYCMFDNIGHILVVYVCLILEVSSYDEYEDIAQKLHIFSNDFESIMFLKIFRSLPLEKKKYWFNIVFIYSVLDNFGQILVVYLNIGSISSYNKYEKTAPKLNLY